MDSLTESTCDRNEDCRNGGHCKFDAKQGISTCQCADRYFGLKCSRYCPLTCQNDGICRFKEDSGEEYLYGLDTNVDHYECKCLGGFAGRQCEAPVVACPDGTSCLNGGECTEKGPNSTIYKCTCPYGIDGEHCEGTEEARTYRKGPVMKEPVSEGGIVAIVIVSLAVVVAIGLYIRMRKRRRGEEIVSAFDNLDSLMMMGRYSDKVSDDEEPDDHGSIEATGMRAKTELI